VGLASMAQLIHLRQRIKAIETIKKITHAMRLISMSTHTQLKHRASYVNSYTQNMNNLFKQIYSLKEEKSSTISKTKKSTLVIIIGSQKGLCGNFNFYIAQHLFEHLKNNSADLIVVGKKIFELAQHSSHTILQTFNAFSIRNLLEISHHITDYILTHEHEYSEVILAHNLPKTFFLQKPTLKTIFPLKDDIQSNQDLDDYEWEQDKHQLFDILLRQYVESQVYNALFESLLAEQAARFISMDSSTRNAKKLLEVTKLQYNKLRQAIITKELTELSSSY
jgi:F-type H+-transporting ATPase subunit gamma